MTVRTTRQGCTVQTKFIIQPNGEVREEIKLSVDPASQLSLVMEECAGRTVDEWSGFVVTPRARSFGFLQGQRLGIF